MFCAIDALPAPITPPSFSDDAATDLLRRYARQIARQRRAAVTPLMPPVAYDACAVADATSYAAAVVFRHARLCWLQRMLRHARLLRDAMARCRRHFAAAHA